MQPPEARKRDATFRFPAGRRSTTTRARSSEPLGIGWPPSSTTCTSRAGRSSCGIGTSRARLSRYARSRSPPRRSSRSPPATTSGSRASCFRVLAERDDIPERWLLMAVRRIPPAPYDLAGLYLLSLEKAPGEVIGNALAKADDVRGDDLAALIAARVESGRETVDAELMRRHVAIRFGRAHPEPARGVRAPGERPRGVLRLAGERPRLRRGRALRQAPHAALRATAPCSSRGAAPRSPTSSWARCRSCRRAR